MEWSLSGVRTSGKSPEGLPINLQSNRLGIIYFSGGGKKNLQKYLEELEE